MSCGDHTEKKNDRLRREIFSAERSVYTKPLLRLKQQERIIERESVAATANMKIDVNILQDISHDRSEISMKSQHFLECLCKSVHDIITELKFVKSSIEDPREMEKLDINAYKARLIKLWQKIQEFKKFCIMQTLIQEQTALESQLSEFALNLQNYDNSSKNRTFQLVSHCKETKKEKLYYKEAQDFHTLVVQTGHTGNWSEEDHLLFLKIRKKCNGIPALVAAMQTKCPDLSAEMIINHESWYKAYVASREKQKLVLKEWRKRKQLEKMKRVERDDENSKENFKCEEIRVKSSGKEIIVRDTTQEPQVEREKWTNNTDPNRNEKKELIKKWKMEKELKRSMDAEQLKMQLKLKQETEEIKRQNRLRNIKQVLCEYRRKKSAEDSLKESNESSKGKSKSNSELIKAFRKQDEEYAKRRKNMILHLKESNQRQTIKVKRPVFTEAKTCSTLFNATKVWNEKCKLENSIRKNASELQYIKDVPRLCIRWRNEESTGLRNN